MTLTPGTGYSFSAQADDLDRLRQAIGDPDEVNLGGVHTIATAWYKPPTAEWCAKTAKALVDWFGEPQLVDGDPYNGRFQAVWHDQMALSIRLTANMGWLPSKWMGRCSGYSDWTRRQDPMAKYRDNPSRTGAA